MLSCSDNTGNKRNNIVHSDTLSINKHTLYIDNITESEFKAVEKKNEYYDSTEIIKRNGVIALNLESKQKLYLRDLLANSDNTNQVTYQYVGFFQKQKFYIVLAQYYETGEYLLIDGRTGKKYKLWGMPKISPKGDLLISSSDALGYDVMFNGIQMWKIEKNGQLNLEWEYKQDQWAPESIDWVNNESFSVVKRIPDYLSLTKKEERKYIKISIE